jgi:rhodanese-related sulfurtransferase
MNFKINNPEEAQKYFEAKMAFTTGPVEADHMRREHRDEVTFIDVRAREDYEKGHVPGSINSPQAEWGGLKGLSKDKLNVVYCYSAVCHLAAKACVQFASQGFPVMEMDGGFKSWKEHKLEVDTETGARSFQPEQQNTMSP